MRSLASTGKPSGSGASTQTSVCAAALRPSLSLTRACTIEVAGAGRRDAADEQALGVGLAVAQAADGLGLLDVLVAVEAADQPLAMRVVARRRASTSTGALATGLQVGVEHGDLDRERRP